MFPQRFGEGKKQVGKGVVKMDKVDESDCDYYKEREKSKSFLEEKVSQRKEIVLISKFISVKKNDFGVLEKTIRIPKYCFIKGKDSISERAFQIVSGNNTLNIPYGAIKEIWEDVSGKINLELRLAIIFDDDATREEERLRLEQIL